LEKGNDPAAVLQAAVISRIHKKQKPFFILKWRSILLALKDLISFPGLNGDVAFSL
jgi:hypothetical protein